jgi:hypothetical protein
MKSLNQEFIKANLNVGRDTFLRSLEIIKCEPLERNLVLESQIRIIVSISTIIV